MTTTEKVTHTQGWLVRNTEHDGDSSWAVKALPNVVKLGKIDAAIQKANGAQ